MHQIIQIQNNLHTHDILINTFLNDPLDALLFYVYDAGSVITTSIARLPFTQANRGQSLLFHEFMQSLVGYELVKVLETFGLQLFTLSDSLKEWSPDLYDIFSYMQTKKSEMKENTLQIVCPFQSNSAYWAVEQGSIGT
jgi:hypothetical protein